MSFGIDSSALSTKMTDSAWRTGLELIFLEEAAERRPHPAIRRSRHIREPEGDGPGEGGLDVALLEVASLHECRTEAETGQELAEVHDHQGEGHDADLTRRDEPQRA